MGDREIRLSKRQARILLRAFKSEDGRTGSLNQYGRQAAAALERRGLGSFHRSDYGNGFAINDAGRRLASEFPAIDSTGEKKP